MTNFLVYSIHFSSKPKTFNNYLNFFQSSNQEQPLIQQLIKFGCCPKTFWALPGKFWSPTWATKKIWLPQLAT
jgi:hypothetical protein